jgi:hypothetical protein
MFDLSASIVNKPGNWNSNPKEAVGGGAEGKSQYSSLFPVVVILIIDVADATFDRDFGDDSRVRILSSRSNVDLNKLGFDIKRRWIWRTLLI